MDAIELLTRDHRHVEELFGQFRSGSDEERRASAEGIIRELSIHAAIEEELFYPAVRKQMPACRALVEAGADLNLTDPDGSSALVLAIVNLHPDVAVLLLEKGANPNVADSAGMAALYAAVEMRSAGRLINRPSRKPTGLVDSLDVAKLILDRGGNPNARLKTPTLPRYHNGGDAQLTDGATPLMRAAKSMDLAAIRLLLDKGADPNLMTKNLRPFWQKVQA